MVVHADLGVLAQDLLAGAARFLVDRASLLGVHHTLQSLLHLAATLEVLVKVETGKAAVIVGVQVKLLRSLKTAKVEAFLLRELTGDATIFKDAGGIGVLANEGTLNGSNLVRLHCGQE